jgi:hypothetical protein
VDTSNLSQTGYAHLDRCAIIDHHEPGDLRCEFSLVKRVSSTAELVFGIYEKAGVHIDADLAFALLLAMVTDTGHFRYASADAFEVAARILKQGGIQFSSVLDFLSQVPTDLSCRIAMLKAASRMTLVREGDRLIVTTKVSSFGAQSAASLVSLGADVAFAGSELDREVRVSGRVKRGVDLDLAVLLNDVGKQYGGSGGGHAAAAGLVIAFGSGIPSVNWALLVPVMLIGSACFTFAGVAVSVNLRSTNAFLGIDGLWEAILLVPPLLLIFGINFALLEALPGSIVLRLMQASAGGGAPFALGLVILALWTAATYYLAHMRLTAALCRLGGGSE